MGVWVDGGVTCGNKTEISIWLKMAANRIDCQALDRDDPTLQTHQMTHTIARARESKDKTWFEALANSE